MTVPTVNAYYDPSVNEMVFPAGALAPQTFDASGDLASNYGSLGGSWAGHELTHGFDDEGAYDAEGNLRDWWAPADSVAFNKQAAIIAKQFSGYVQVDTIHVNGDLTLGENLADFGGMVTAYDALERALTRTGKREVINGYTPEQRFFIGRQSWRSHTRPEQLRTRVKVDPHAPAEWRTNGPFRTCHSLLRRSIARPVTRWSGLRIRFRTSGSTSGRGDDSLEDACSSRSRFIGMRVRFTKRRACPQCPGHYARGDCGREDHRYRL